MKNLKLPLDYIDFLLLIFIDKGYGSNEFLAQICDRAISVISHRVDKLESLDLVYREGTTRNCLYRNTDLASKLIIETYRQMNISLIEIDTSTLNSSIVVEEYSLVQR